MAPFFFLLLFAIIEAGRFILYYETLNNATREGARYAIVHGSNSFCPSGPMPNGRTPPACYDLPGDNVVKQVRDTAFGVLGAGVAVAPVWEPPPVGNGRDAEVRVTATFTYGTLLPLVPLPAITITAESTLVINN